MKEEYNKSYPEKDYEKLPDLSEQTTKKSRSVLKVVLICLSVILVVSFVYDNIVKSYIEKKKEEIEKIISTSDDESVDDEDDITSHEDEDKDDEDDYDIIDDQPIMDNSPKRTRASSEDYSGLSTSEILDRQTHAMVVKQAQQAGVSTKGSTSEILDRITHAEVVK